MKNILTNLLKLSAFVIVAILVGVTSTYAIGSLTPSGTSGDDTHYSLNDIYSKLVDFTNAPSATSSPFAVPGSVTASFRTLTEIYNLLLAEEDDLVAENIRDGVTVFGVDGAMVEGSYTVEWSTEQGNMTLATASSTCDSLTEGGATAGDWRLPTERELISGLLDQFVSETETGFVSGLSYWSGSYMDGGYWYAGYDGHLEGWPGVDPEFSFRVRCVR